MKLQGALASSAQPEGSANAVDGCSSLTYDQIRCVTRAVVDGNAQGPKEEKKKMLICHAYGDGLWQGHESSIELFGSVYGQGLHTFAVWLVVVLGPSRPSCMPMSLQLQ
jgi:hypothetical protein